MTLEASLSDEAMHPFLLGLNSMPMRLRLLVKCFVALETAFFTDTSGPLASMLVSST